jgi:hypothetical protein
MENEPLASLLWKLANDELVTVIADLPAIQTKFAECIPGDWEHCEPIAQAALAAMEAAGPSLSGLIIGSAAVFIPWPSMWERGLEADDISLWMTKLGMSRVGLDLLETYTALLADIGSEYFDLGICANPDANEAQVSSAATGPLSDPHRVLAATHAVVGSATCWELMLNVENAYWMFAAVNGEDSLPWPDYESAFRVANANRVVNPHFWRHILSVKALDSGMQVPFGEVAYHSLGWINEFWHDWFAPEVKDFLEGKMMAPVLHSLSTASGLDPIVRQLADELIPELKGRLGN